ncbi:hypothetical protein COL80_16160 [Bacillus thuringiensis]|nr:hypothetical protein COL80_16160 [Bacillus thuringiensis]
MIIIYLLRESLKVIVNILLNIRNQIRSIIDGFPWTFYENQLNQRHIKSNSINTTAKEILFA